MMEYFVILKNDIPQNFYAYLLFLICVGVVLFTQLKFTKTIRGFSKMLLVEYLLIVYSLTVFFRSDNNVRKYDYTPFWSYERPELVVENMMNIVGFVPVGLLIGCAISGMKWWKALLIGSGISMTIEILQLVFMRGFSEVDDVIHNTLGCMIGYTLYSIVRYSYNRKPAI